MKKYFLLWQDLKKEFSNSQIIDAFFGALLYDLLIAIPALLAMAQIISIYMFRLTLWVVLIIIIVILLNFLLHYWWKKALYLKHPETTTNVKALFLINQMIINVFIVIIGLLFILVIIPALIV